MYEELYILILLGLNFLVFSIIGIKIISANKLDI